MVLWQFVPLIVFIEPLPPLKQCCNNIFTSDTSLFFFRFATFKRNRWNRGARYELKLKEIFHQSFHERLFTVIVAFFGGGRVILYFDSY